MYKMNVMAINFELTFYVKEEMIQHAKNHFIKRMGDDVSFKITKVL